MMMNLFSSFDPMMSMMKIQMGWLFMFYAIMVGYLPYWLVGGGVLNLVFKMIYSEVKSVLMSSSNMLLIVSLFMLFLIINLLGLMPYTFVSTSHMALVYSLAIWMNFSIWLMSWSEGVSKVMYSLVPVGTPLVLMPLMVLIETVSDWIRPITLSVRIAANLTAGHLILILVSSMGENLSLFLGLSAGLIYWVMMILELAVACIQSYVFVILLSLYLKN